MKAAGIAAAVGFVGIAVFQLALALGAPLGRAAWGGGHERLPARLRVGSAIAVVVWLVAAAIVLTRAGFQVGPVPSAAARLGTWALVVVLPLGSVMNFLSRSRWERYIWAPVSLLLAILCLVLALGP